MTIDWNQLIQTVAIVFLPVIATVLTILLRSHMNDKTAADAISQALNNALGAMQQAVQKGLTDGAIKKAGVEYVKAVVPEALARDPAANTDALIGEKLDARMGVANIATNLAIAASPQPENPHPLAAVPAASEPAPFVPQPKVFGMEGKST
jgi:hypothetical protein